MPLVLAPILAFLFAALRIFLIANAVGFLVRILVAFGLNIILIQPAIDTIMALLRGQFGILPEVAAEWVGFFNLDRYIGLILSAYGIQQTGNFIFRINR